MTGTIVAAVTFASGTAASQLAGAALLTTANATGSLGLYDANSFSLAIEGEGAAPTSRLAAWYFRDETVAVPHAGLPISSYEPGVRAFDDLQHWAIARSPDAVLDYPPLVWVAAPQVIRDARLASGGQELLTTKGALPLQFVPKIALNRSYLDASSIAFFEPHTLTLRGTLTPQGFVARSVWPQDFSLGPKAPAERAMPAGDPAGAMRTLMREMPQGGARSPY
ncbi:MAG: hypothetical protein ABI633_08215, partial [Burkholderiales bacterium]